MNETTWSKELSQLATSGALLTQDAILDGVRGLTGFRYQKRDFLLKSGTWRGVEQSWALGDKSTKTLVIGHSDRGFGRPHMRILQYSGTKPSVVWATNLATRIPGVRSLPIGLTNFCDDTPLHRIFGDQRHFVEARADGPFEPAFYLNFSAKTSREHRAPLIRLAQDLKNAKLGTVDFSANGRVKYLEEMRRFGLVLCPRGNGLDTHRTWEALATGAVPVLLKRHAPAYLDHFPKDTYHTLDTWEDLKSLDPGEILSLKKRPPIDLLTSSYWLKQIVSSNQ